MNNNINNGNQIVPNFTSNENNSETLSQVTQNNQQPMSEMVQNNQQPMPEMVQNSQNMKTPQNVSTLNKEEAMEEALSHTNEYTPFKVQKEEVNKEQKKTNNKSAYIFIGIILFIMLLFIIFLPQISKLFGW